VVVCHSDLDLASGSRVHCRRAHSVVLTGVMTGSGIPRCPIRSRRKADRLIPMRVSPGEVSQSPVSRCPFAVPLLELLPLASRSTAPSSAPAGKPDPVSRTPCGNCWGQPGSSAGSGPYVPPDDDSR
jgi:hypothetical protein